MLKDPKLWFEKTVYEVKEEKVKRKDVQETIKIFP